VEAVIVKAEFAEGDESGLVGGGVGGGDERGEVGDDGCGPGGVDGFGFCWCGGFGWVRVAGWGVLILALALIVMTVVGDAEDGTAARMDACRCEDGAGFLLFFRFRG
jgi:hypothetical protein